MNISPLTEPVNPSSPLRWWPNAPIVSGLVLVVIVSVCATLNHYGLTYDEGWYISQSIRARKWVGLLLADPRWALSDEGIRQYWAAERQFRGKILQEQQPGGVKLICGLPGYALGVLSGAVFPERAGSALFLAGCVTALYLLMARTWGRVAAAFGALQLPLMPRIFAHAHLCALDTAVMSMMFVAVALMFAAVRKRSLTLACLSGLAWGFAMNCKINAVLVPLILGAWGLALHRGFTLYAAAALLGCGIPAYLLSWPWLWHDTLARLGAYLAFHLRHYPVAVSYFGHVSGEQPWHYPAVMTAITTPPVALVLGIVGIMLASRRVVRPKKVDNEPWQWQRSQALLLLIGALITIGFNSLPSAPKYTGVRLFLPFFPFLSALSAIGLSEVLRLLDTRGMLMVGSLLTPGRIRVALASILLLPALRSLIEVHPYQLSYYNLFIGGLQGAVARGMEATYWGDTYLASVAFVASHATPADEVWVDLPGCEWLVRHHLLLAGVKVRVTSGGWPGPQVAWAIVQNKASELSPASRALLASGPPAFAVELDGVPLNLVYNHDSIVRVRRLNSSLAGQTIEGEN
ncbi:MAG: ArnT family glycosyltransferase [Candidatus Zipacnadales bacterium]